MMIRTDDESRETDDEDLSELLYKRQSHEQRVQQGGRTQNARWRLFMVAVMFLSQVFVEMGRRSMQCLQRSVPRYIAFMDRWLVQSVRMSVCPGKKMGTLRLLLVLGLAFVLPYIVLTIRRMRFPTGRGIRVNVEELDEEKILSHIIVDREGTPVPKRRQTFLREGDDGLKVDQTESRCENTVQGVSLLTDSMGYVCTRAQLQRAKPGCCNETDASLPRIKRFTCDRCDTNPPHCCDVFEHCVSCCMHPLNSATRRNFLIHADPNHPVYNDPTETTVFQYCQYRCRTSSASVQHQNSYRSYRSFCYGIHRPLNVLPTVNSDDLYEEWSGASREGVHDHLVLSSQLELDPYYLEYELSD